MEFNEKQKKIYDKLVHTGASELFAGFVLKYPDSIVAESFLAGHNGGHFFTYLWENDIVKALQRADTENYRRVKALLFPDDENLNKVFSYIPAYLTKCDREKCKVCQNEKD